MKKKLVSIIIPIYNSEKYLEECIVSVIQQTYRHIEIILINDGSTDNSLKIMENFKKSDSRIKIINSKNEGVSSSRNKGYLKSNGEFIYFMDSDDILEKNAIFKSIKYIENTNSDICVFNFDYLEEKGVLRKNLNKIGNKCISRYDYIIQIISDSRVKGFVWNRLYRREVIEKLNREKLFDEEIYIQEDNLFNCEVAMISNRICYLDDKLYLYRIFPQSTSAIAINKENYIRKMSVLKAMKIKIKLFEKYNKNISRSLTRDYIIIANDLIELMKTNNLPYINIEKTIKEIFDYKILICGFNDYIKKTKVLFIVFFPRLYNFIRMKKNKR